MTFWLGSPLVVMHQLATSALLCTILAVAAYSDIRTHRISNRLSLLGLVAGMVLQYLAHGLQGVTSGLLGAGVGLGCFAPFYMLRAMGAGDVKLLAAVGAALGPQGAFFAVLFSLLAGGFGAIGYVMWRGLRASVSSFVHEGFTAAGASALVAAQLARRDRLPFALPIAVGGIAACWYSGVFFAADVWLRGALI
jgi:prepilin peptidase CpaA